MVAQYKINEKVILTDSGGTRNLFVNGAITFNDSDGKTLTIRNTKKTLTPDFFTNYFHRIQGATSGYASGGGTAPGGVGVNTIENFPFATDTNSSDVGDLTVGRFYVAGQSSSTHGYVSGGYVNPSSTDTFYNIIDKFPFSVDANATDVGNLPRTTGMTTGQSSSTHGHTSGGKNPSLITNITKFSFAADADGTDVGDLTVAREVGAGQSSSENGYTSGGQTPSKTNVIDKFPFSSDDNATDVGDLTQARSYGAGQSSSDNGYTSGGHVPSWTNIIDKFPFSADANATDVGDLTVSRGSSSSQSSITHGYNSGGQYPFKNEIDKFTFSSDANATDVGNLISTPLGGSGQQV